MSDVDARYLGLTANQLALIATDLKAENAKLRDQLARRKCHLVKEHFGHSGGAYRMVCSECHHLVWDGMGLQEKPRYCAFCGAEVEQ